MAEKRKYDDSKDEVFFEAVLGNGLQLKVVSHNNGPKKLQIGPRLVKVDPETGEAIYRKAGRLSKEEVSDLCCLLQEDLGKALGI